jgi:hypothetical protein
MDDCFYKAQIGDSKSITKFFEYNWLLKEKSQEKNQKKKTFQYHLNVQTKITRVHFQIIKIILKNVKN